MAWRGESEALIERKKGCLSIGGLSFICLYYRIWCVDLWMASKSHELLMFSLFSLQFMGVGGSSNESMIVTHDVDLLRDGACFYRAHEAGRWKKH